MRQGLFEDGVRPQFAGHETFPLRLLWLKKAHDAVAAGAPAGTFAEQEAIATFGVGRNMAASIRHWAVATGFVAESDRALRPTHLGRMILADGGLDPYLEAPATTWLAHWNVASTPELTTTAYFAFNGLTAIEFDPDGLVTELESIAATRGWRATRGTLKRDVETFLRSYVRRRGQHGEDAAEPLLAELGLVREARLGGWYEFVRGPKPGLPDAVFAYALDAFWRRHGGASLTAEQVSYAPGSPGRVFKLDEDSVVTRLMALPRLTAGAWGWTDTAGLRQVQRISEIDALALVPKAYGHASETAAA
ncbi:DUF4007 family protein [Sphingomonas sp. 28-62-11]|uniref:DUF4007 family protein n=1 Tax=Sphingomonas sp. 28-62-11 TaxID=1970432 RepID=UPI000BD1EF2B|nr:MAG: hypothetical protein B7Y49_02005 [Sphingomonas sp. 28-62-11]